MKLSIHHDILKEALASCDANKSLNLDVTANVDFIPNNEYLNNLLEYARYHVDLDLSKIELSLVESLYSWAKSNRGKSSDINKFSIKLGSYIRLLNSGDDVVIKQIQSLADPLKMYMAKFCTNGLITHSSKIGSDKIDVYYLVADVKYSPSSRDSPACVCISCLYSNRGKIEKKLFVVDSQELAAISNKKGVTSQQVLASMGLNCCSAEVVEQYKTQFDEWSKIVRESTTGELYTIKSSCFYKSMNSWHRSTYCKDDGSTRLVVDENTEATGARMMDDDNISNSILEIPVHPFIKIFDLTNHTDGLVHIDYIKPYVYDTTMIDKLVLRKETKNFIDILLGGVDDIKQDIVAGKTGGIITLLSGVPGVGKTLTAEVYSELIGVPLYKVQSTQLGIEVDTIEDNLKNILDRASRWGAVLLLDECEVYIRRRENDLVQNAIVGVFLRTLEYYSGILFLTTNLPDSIDDAIVSRCIAHLHYELPNVYEATKITEILAKQFDLDMGGHVIGKFIEKYHRLGSAEQPGGLSGRDIKQFLKLVGMVSVRNKSKITIETFDYVSGFHSGSIGR